MCAALSERHVEDAAAMMPEQSQRPNGSTAAAQVEQAVRWTRFLVVTVFCLCAVVVGSLTYVVISREEQQDYEKQYEKNALEVLRVVSHKATTTVQMAASMTRIYTSLVREGQSNTSGSTEVQKQQQLPYVTLPNFEAFGQRVRQGSSASLFAYTPYLATEQARGEWVDHALEHTDWVHHGHTFYDNYTGSAQDYHIPGQIWRFDSKNRSSNASKDDDTEKFWTKKVDLEGPVYTPVWQMSPPPPDTSRIQLNLVRHSNDFRRLVESVRESGKVTLSAPLDVRDLFGSAVEDSPIPNSILLQPVYNADIEGQGNGITLSSFVAAVSAVMPWTVYFDNVLHEGTNGIVVVVDSCGQNNTYTIDGPLVQFVGAGDLHDTDYTDMVISGPITYRDEESTAAADIDKEDFCRHHLYIFPSSTFEEAYKSFDPAVYTVVVVSMVVFSALVFLVYDVSVEQRTKITQRMANRTNDLVSQLFPGAVRDLLFRHASHDNLIATKKGKAKSSDGIDEETGAAGRAKHAFLSQGENRSMADRPIAELFPEATVLYGDIAGFTAWSSIREPQHVFTLLESIFRAFDEIAAKYGVFKVETIGDCYVAVVGVPDPCTDHAVVMARFARDCLDRFASVVRGLELSLGPDTSDLAMRIGIHSGPVTAGVLRGDRARFQLFGDTVNVTAKIESTGRRECVHLSQTTADLISQAGHSDWITPRADLVDAKDLGVIETFWLKTNAEYRGSLPSGSQADDDEILLELQEEEEEEGGEDGQKEVAAASSNIDEEKGKRKKGKRRSTLKKKQANREKRIQRLVDWNTELLAQLLRQVMARREITKNGRKAPTNPATLMVVANSLAGNSRIVVEEVAEVISMPAFERANSKLDPEVDAEISEEALEQLHLYVSTIASLYRNNPFHNFEHASHVTMSVSKLLARIVSPQNTNKSSPLDSRSEEEKLHEHTYGIATDPLTQFSVVLSALIHDVDHRGVPNFVLASEDKTLAAAYKGKSIAEQNSVDLAWNALMSEGFEELRKCIFTDVAELRRFRQLLINSVIATDIFDKELGMARKKRWRMAFDEGNSSNDNLATEESKEVALDLPPTETKPDGLDRKATIVIEHLIQASDVAHTMQHWHVYCKWNEKLFAEMYESFLSGRTDKDPSIRWYEGELGFFDSYIIPLAKKLKECGVFGVASDEYLIYATENRAEWEIKGQEVVAKYVEKYSN